MTPQWWDPTTDDGQRAVSEVVSFLLIFSLLISVSITGAVFGIDSLETASRDDTIHFAERSLDTLRADMYDLSSGAAYRSTDIEMVEGSIRYADPISITVTAESTVGEMDPFTIHPQPIVYDLGTYDLLIVSGAVILQQPDGGVVKTGPILRIGPEQSILPLLNSTHEDGPASVGGSGTASVVSYRWGETTRRYEPTDAGGTPINATVTVSVETPRTKQWRSYFAGDPRFENVTVDEGTDTVRAQFTTKRVYIKATDVKVRFDV